MPNTTIKCPNCQTKIDVNEILYHQLADKFEKENKIREDALDKKFELLQAQEEKFEEALKKATKEQVRHEKRKLYDELKKELLLEQSESMALLEKELNEKSEQVKELNRSKIEINRLKREKEEIEFKVKAEAQLRLENELNLEKRKILDNLERENELKLKAKDEQLAQIKRELDNAQRKVAQGSMQIQGEVLEVAIESWLSSMFPFDSITEVKKGTFGVDCIQIIHTRESQNCGIICYESKNTKSWSDGWISKLKQDMLNVNADMGVLVSSVYPKNMKRMGFIDGIWVCSLDEFKGSASLLRESLIRLHKSIEKDENRTDKMNLLYSYMTGNEFSMQMTAIVDGFMKMQEELNKEKRSVMASWKRREKIIDGVLQNTTEMYGALQGIAGNSAIVHIDALELPNE